MKKGQTALEYLMTYGWAILIVIIVISALYALGLAKPCKWTGTQIREFADFRVAEAKYSGTTLQFSLSYLRPEGVDAGAIIAASVEGKTGSCSYTTTSALGSTPQAITIDNCPAVTAGDCYTANVNITYNVTGGTVYNLVSFGKISGVAA